MDRSVKKIDSIPYDDSKKKKKKNKRRGSLRAPILKLIIQITTN